MLCMIYTTAILPWKLYGIGKFTIQCNIEIIEQFLWAAYIEK